MQTYDEYKMDERLSALIYEQFDMNIVIKLINSYRLLAVYGNSTLDTEILDHLTNSVVVDSDVKDIIMEYTKLNINKLFKESGVSLYLEASIDIYLSVLSLFKYIDDLDPNLLVKLAEDVSDDSVDNETLLSRLLLESAGTPLIESYAGIEYVTDYYLNIIKERGTIIDTEVTDHNLFMLANNNNDMKKTSMYGLALAGVPIGSNINQYISLYIKNLLLHDTNSQQAKIIADEIVSVLYFFRNKDLHIIDLYQEYIVDILFDNLSMKYQDMLSKYVKINIEKIKENMRLYYD